MADGISRSHIKRLPHPLNLPQTAARLGHSDATAPLGAVSQGIRVMLLQESMTVMPLAPHLPEPTTRQRLQARTMVVEAPSEGLIQTAKPSPPDAKKHRPTQGQGGSACEGVCTMVCPRSCRLPSSEEDWSCPYPGCRLWASPLPPLAAVFRARQAARTVARRTPKRVGNRASRLRFQGLSAAWPQLATADPGRRFCKRNSRRVERPGRCCFFKSGAARLPGAGAQAGPILPGRFNLRTATHLKVPATG